MLCMELRQWKYIKWLWRKIFFPSSAYYRTPSWHQVALTTWTRDYAHFTVLISNPCTERRIISIFPRRDGNRSSFVTHDPWPLHYFIQHMGLEGAWHRGTRQPYLGLNSKKKSQIKIKLPAMIKGLIERVSEQFLDVYSNLQATAQLFHHGSMGHWQWHPCDPSKNGDPFPSLPPRAMAITRCIKYQQYKPQSLTANQNGNNA